MRKSKQKSKYYTVKVELQPQDDIVTKLVQLYDILLTTPINKNPNGQQLQPGPVETPPAVHNDYI